LKTHKLFSVHTTLEKFANGVFTLKTRQLFAVRYTGHFGFVFEENSGDIIVFEKLRFRNVFRPH